MARPPRWTSPAGALVDVLEPPTARAELARIGAELVARYGDH
nr:hypothetical protein [Amycolatopsis arida]